MEKIESAPDLPSSPTVITHTVDQLEQELSSQIPANIKEPTSTFGYVYTGKGYITQETFWFHSCIMLNCINTVAVRLLDIKSVRVIRDNSVINDGTKSNHVLAIELNQGSDEPLIFTSLMDDIEVLCEKLKFAVENAKSSKPSPIQTTYDIIHALSASKFKSNNQVKTIIKSSAEPSPSSSTLSLPDLIPSRSTETKKKPSAPRKFSAPVKPKSGALAAAMMAATVAGGSGFFDAKKELQEEYQNMLKNKKTKATTAVTATSNTLPEEVIVSSSQKSFESTPQVDDPHALPNDFKLPSGPVNCKCENHLDKLESEVELPISAKRLYHILFDEENPQYLDIWERKTAENKSRDLSMTKWEQGIEGKLERTLKYIIPVNNAMVKLKEAEAIEKQVFEKKEEYLCYVVMTTTKTPQLPYADAFVPYLKYCITWVSQDRCRLACHTGVKFLKNILVKGIVNKAAMKGMSENLEVFVPIIQNEVSKLTDNKSNQNKKPSREVSLKRAGTIKKPSTVEKKKETKDEWYNQYIDPVIQTVHDLVEGLPLVVKASFGALIILWFLYSWIFRPSSPTNVNNPSERRVISRAVYLKDIDEGIFHSDVKSAYEQFDSFRLFLESNSRNQTQKGYKHNWYSARHRQLATDLLFSRERVAMLRHDALVLFQLVNEVDAQLLENEYTNWLMDIRLQCLSPEFDNNEMHCNDVKRQLIAFPIRSIKRT
ncbi:hypothetical protein G6F61_002916 [Rhizopus arrhizus]|nr:hypothetical protein G6F61_002916 [Rhizopus arrhizus]